jgi:hypothetical protein
VKKLLYITVPKIIYLIINLLETLNFRIVLMTKTQHLIAGKRNNYSFLVVYRSRYFIYLPKHLIRPVLTKRIII